MNVQVVFGSPLMLLCLNVNLLANLHLLTTKSLKNLRVNLLSVYVKKKHIFLKLKHTVWIVWIYLGWRGSLMSSTVGACGALRTESGADKQFGDTLGIVVLLVLEQITGHRLLRQLDR